MTLRHMACADWREFDMAFPGLLPWLQRRLHMRQLQQLRQMQVRTARQERRLAELEIFARLYREAECLA